MGTLFTNTLLENTHTMNTILIFLLPSLTQITFSLKCHHGKNVDLFWAARYDETVFADRASIMPFVDSVDEFDKLPEVKECPDDESAYECYLTAEFPKIDENLVKTAYDHEISRKTGKQKVAVENYNGPVKIEGYKIKGLEMGCRKKDESVQKYREKRGIHDQRCITGVDHDDDKTDYSKSNVFSCGCVPEKCDRQPESCERLERRSCNSEITLPSNAFNKVWHKKEEILRSFRRAEEL